MIEGCSLELAGHECRRHLQNRDPRVRDLDPAAHLDPGDIGQLYVEQYKSRIDFAYEIQGRASCRGFPHFKSGLPQDARFRIAKRFRVIDVKQDAGSMHGWLHPKRWRFREHPR